EPETDRLELHLELRVRHLGVGVDQAQHRAGEERAEDGLEPQALRERDEPDEQQHGEPDADLRGGVGEHLEHSHRAHRPPGPQATAIANDSTNPAAASFSGRPRSRCTSISSPARNSRNARPTRASTSTGASTATHPSSDGPRTMPATISSTGEGTRTTGIARTTSGAANATAETINRFMKDMAIPYE